MLFRFDADIYGPRRIATKSRKNKIGLYGPVVESEATAVEAGILHPIFGNGEQLEERHFTRRNPPADNGETSRNSSDEIPKRSMKNA